MSFTFVLKTAVIAALTFVLCGLCAAQTGPKAEGSLRSAPASLPDVKKIDIHGLRSLIKPKGKPLLINFWATWCDPCREEFPDLVKIGEEFKGKIDFATVSLDDLADIQTHVPKFLSEVKSKMPAYLLHTPDESAAIRMVSATWPGNLPMTILYNSDGTVSYSRNGKIRYEIVAAEINKLLTPTTPSIGEWVGIQAQTLELLPKPPRTFEEGVDDAKRDIANWEFKIVRYGMAGVAPSAEYDRLLKKYSVTVTGMGCLMPAGFPEYAEGYNQTSRIAFQKKFGIKVARKLGFVE